LGITTETISDLLSALGIHYLIGERKLAVANLIGTASGQLFARVKSQECRDVRVISALLAAHGLELQVKAPSGFSVLYSPHVLPTADTIARWGDVEKVREARRVREAGSL
jgi:hypothetical protein